MQKVYKTGQDWELREKFKSYIHNSESISANEMHKLLRGFEIQTDHLILVRRADLEFVDI